MQAAVVDAVGAGFKIAEVELAHPLGREVLIDVRASGRCHTDLTIATQDVGVFPMPVLCGHEVAGLVVEIGPQVTQFETSDRVAACLVQSCGTCAVCLARRPYQCPNGATLMRGAHQAPRISRGGQWYRPRSAWTRLSPVTRSSPTRKSAESSSPDSESPKACAL
jgi:S-(hydroxymethyl)glutathione dehydrogenase / alcohol dehydrogenase